MASQLIIKSPRPGRQALLVLLVLISIAAAGVGGIYYGRKSSGLNNEVLQSQRDHLQAQVYSLETEAQEMREKYAMLERSTDIDQKSYQDVKLSLRTLENELLELKEEVTFYRGIVSPKEATSGLDITSFKLRQLEHTAGYHMKLVLSQLKQNDQMINGKANIFIEGILEGKQKRLAMSDVAGEQEGKLQMHFKYFQNIEQDIVLPEGFVPSSVVVDLIPGGKGQQRITRTFSWSEITS